MKARPDTGRSTLAQIREHIDHPIVDADAHQLEVMPALLDIVRDLGGAAMVDRWIGYLKHSRRAFAMPAVQREDERAAIPVWWPVPGENTLDRATTTLPRLLHERMDELGIDFSIVYPGVGMSIVTLPGIADDDLRRVAARAFNIYSAEMFAGLGDRLTPAGVVPMHTPDEAVEELEYLVNVLGLKVALLAGDVLRPVPSVAREHPDLASLVLYQDCFGIDSPYDYDPVWVKCVELKVAPTFHSGPIGWGCRASVSRHQYNQIGGFAEGGEAIAKSLFFGGVTRRFPELNFGFLEGGVQWAQGLYCRMIEHWKKRNGEAIMHLDPSRIDAELFGDLIDKYGGERVRQYRDDLMRDAGLGERMEELDDWRACQIDAPEQIRDLFVPRFFFGCEGDDRTATSAFDEGTNPYGARLGAMFGSDVGHFDVEDMSEVVEEAYELVDSGLFDERDFREFAFTNVVRLHGGMNPSFFDGSRVEAAAQVLLSRGEPARR